MNRIVLGVLLGAVLGALDGMTAWFTPEVRTQLAGIIVGSTIKGLIAGVLIGVFARKVHSLALGIVFGLAVGLLLAFIVARMQHGYYFQIMLPGGMVGLIVGYATQRYGRGFGTATHLGFEAKGQGGASINLKARGRSMGKKNFYSTITVTALMAALTIAASASASDLQRERAVKIVTQIQRADYEGDRVALGRLPVELLPFVEDKEMASRARYWRGFALWRTGDQRFQRQNRSARAERRFAASGG